MRSSGRGAWIRAVLASALLAAPFGAFAQSSDPARADYERLCAGCHGATFRLPSGAPTTRGAGDIAGIIRDGIALKGMPAFGAQLSADRIEALAKYVRPAPRGAARRAGTTIEGGALLPEHSANYVFMDATDRTRFVGYFSERSALCYDDVDLTGVRSLEIEYAKGNEDEGRYAIVIGDGVQTPRVNLGEKLATPTGGWEAFKRHRIGLAREVSGAHLLCLYGVSGGGIFNLARFTLSGERGEHDGITLDFAAAPPPPVFTAAGYTFRLERVAELSSDLWGMAFLPDGAMLVTQKNGQVILFRNGQRVGTIEGTPPVWSGGQGGMMDVKPHPDYSANGWIYLTFSDPGADPATSMTRVVRGQLDGLRWVRQQDVFRAPARFYTGDYAHYGSRLAFADGYVFVSVGERQQPEHAQELSYPYGKIHRLHDDGRVPTDNPFAGRDDALPSIWSFGHRNPQGMTLHDRVLWVAEHGPMGGDELNFIRPGVNYGWPLVSFGKHYDGTPVSDSPYRDGVEPPVHHWTPSIAVSQIAFHAGRAFSDWNGQLLVSSLGQQQLRLVRLRDGRVLNDQLLFSGQGRIRDVAVSPEGYVHVLLNRTGGGIYRLMPVEESKAKVGASAR